MKKLLIVCCGLLFSVPVFALQGGRSRLEIAYEGMGYSYREPHMEHPISAKADLKNGISLKYTSNEILGGFASGGEDNSFYSLEARFLKGDVDYRGSTWGGDPLKADGLTDWYVEGRLLIGQYWDLNDVWKLSPYFGFGYRFLSNHADEMSGGYRRESTYFYVPVGAGLNWQVGSGWSIAFNGEFDWMLKGNQKSCMSDIDLEYPYEDYSLRDARNDQTKGFGLRASVKLEKELGSFAIFVEPFYRFWKIQNSEWEPLMISNGTESGYIVDESGMVSGLIEPFNISREYGVRIGIAF